MKSFFRGCSPLFSKTFILAYITQNVSIKEKLDRNRGHGHAVQIKLRYLKQLQSGIFIYSIGRLLIDWLLSKVGGGGGGGGKKNGKRKKRTDKQTNKQEHEIFPRKLVRVSIFPLSFHHFSIDDQWEEFKTRDEEFAVQTCFL